MENNRSKARSAARVPGIRSVSSAVALVLAGAAVPALGEPSPAAASSPTDSQLEDVVVTGSRIEREGFSAPTPTTIVSAEDIARSGATNVGQIAQSIPAFLGVNTPTGSVFTSTRAGGSFLNLRALGDNRTLVLVNGRRFVPTNPEATVDTNVIPSALIERVDVVTGGASAAYGADAVAGVVNIILRQQLDGFRGDLQTGISEQSDNKTLRGSLAWGTEFGAAGNLLIAGEYERNEGVGAQTRRGWSSQGYGVVGNPGGTPTRRLLPDTQFASQTLGGIVTSGVLRGTEFLPGGASRTFVAGPGDGFFQVGGGGVRGSDYINLAVPFSRQALYAAGGWEFGTTRAFFEASHARSQGDLDIIPASNFGTITIQRDNAYLAPALAGRLLAAGETSFRMGRFLADFGPLTVDIENRTNRLVAGLEGRFGGEWKWEVYAEYGDTESENLRGNNQNLARFARSVDAVNGPNGPVCRVNANAVTTDDDPACVPVNLFGFGSPSEPAQRYFLGTSALETQIDQRVVAANLTGDLFRIGDRAVAVAGGAEYRTEEVAAAADPLSEADGFAFGNPKSLRGDQNVTEVYGEVLVPLVADAAFAKAFDVDAAVRWTDYSGSGDATTWKGGLSWQITDDVRLRATRSRDIRAPNLAERFATSNVLFVTLRDPTRGNASSTVPQITRGNPALEPEEADTFTAGIVLTPSFVSGLRVALDYYTIEIDGAVAALTSQETLNRCVAGNLELCAFIQRDAGGAISQVVRTQVNVAEVKTSGFDLETSYTLPVSALGIPGEGQLGLRLLATYVEELSTRNGAVFVDRAGEVGGNNQGVPRFRYTLGLSYDQGPLGLYLENRFVGAGAYDRTFDAVAISRPRVGSIGYLDVSARYRFETAGTRVELFADVNNALDRDPPIVPSASFAPLQTNPFLYDVIGRMYSVGVRMGF